MREEQKCLEENGFSLVDVEPGQVDDPLHPAWLPERGEAGDPTRTRSRSGSTSVFERDRAGLNADERTAGGWVCSWVAIMAMGRRRPEAAGGPASRAPALRSTCSTGGTVIYNHPDLLTSTREEVQEHQHVGFPAI
jgi:hypothetical protein